MKKIFIVGAFIQFLFCIDSSYSQNKITTIKIASKYVRTYSDTPIDIAIENATTVYFHDTSISSLYFGSEHPSRADYYYESKDSIIIGIDTNAKIITSLHAVTSNAIRQNLPWIYDITGSFVNCYDMPYTTSKMGDTLLIYLRGKQLSRINLSEGNFKVTSRGRSYDSIYDIVFAIPDSAYLSVILVGTFPLGVAVTNKENPTSIITNSASKILKLSSQSLKQTQTLPCYDLLGRKHDLELLGTDGTASTYSVRSLRSGVYFVSDGKEMVKFMIGE